MTRTVIAIFFVFISISCFAMDSLTTEESNCWMWSEQPHLKKVKTAAYKDLCDEHKHTLQKYKYSEHPQEVTQAMYHYAVNFYEAAQELGIKIPYEKEFIITALLKIKIAVQNQVSRKPTDRLSANIYVFSQLLTQEERDTYKKESYVANPDATHAVVKKFATLLANELAKLGIIPDTEEAKLQEAHDYIAKKTLEFAQVYAE